jgi:hypothetical protein
LVPVGWEGGKAYWRCSGLTKAEGGSERGGRGGRAGREGSAGKRGGRGSLRSCCEGDTASSASRSRDETLVLELDEKAEDSVLSSLSSISPPKSTIRRSRRATRRFRRWISRSCPSMVFSSEVRLRVRKRSA